MLTVLEHYQKSPSIPLFKKGGIKCFFTETDRFTIEFTNIPPLCKRGARGDFAVFMEFIPEVSSKNPPLRARVTRVL